MRVLGEALSRLGAPASRPCSRGYVAWAQGPPRNAIRDWRPALLAQPPGGHAPLARRFGPPAAATTRWSRRLHTAGGSPGQGRTPSSCKPWGQLPALGPGRQPSDWTSAGPQPLRVISRRRGRRAVPIEWRAYEATRRPGRRKHSALAGLRRAVTRGRRPGGRRRDRLTADRGCADVARCTRLSALGVAGGICVKQSPPSARGHAALATGCPGPRGALVGAGPSAGERSASHGRRRLSARRRGRGRAAHWCGGVPQARITQTTAWSRLWTVVARALLSGARQATRRLWRGAQQARAWLRRGASRRRGRGEWSRRRAMMRGRHHEPEWADQRAPRIQRKQDGNVANVS
jgi:hypothetical protein